MNFGVLRNVCVCGVVLLLLFGIGPNLVLCMLAVVVLSVGYALLWRPSESPVLLFVFTFQWIQASIAIFYANWLGEDVSRFSPLGGSAADAVEMSLIGLFILALGIRVGAGRPCVAQYQALRMAAFNAPIKKWFWLYIFGAAGSFVLVSFALAVPGLSQLFLAFASLKWALFFTLACATLLRVPGERRFLAFAFGAEFLQGIGGYFSDFKTVFIVTFCASFASGARISGSRIVGLGLLGGAVIFLGIVWTAIKPDYRAYVSGGTNDQVVMVDYADRMSKMVSLVSQLDGHALSSSADLFLRRLSFTEYFGVVLDVVPSSVPHTNGAIWFDALSRPFMPRLFFPEKTAINDTERTNMFTHNAAGNYSATSVSMGYMPESYIDFGPVGMMFPIFGFGYMCGSIQRYFTTSKTVSRLFGSGLATAILLNASDLGSSITKTFGAVIVSAMVAWAFAKFAAPRWFPWLLVKQ